MKTFMFVMAAGLITLAAGPAAAQGSSAGQLKTSACIDCGKISSETSIDAETEARRARAAEREACKASGGQMRRGECVAG